MRQGSHTRKFARKFCVLWNRQLLYVFKDFHAGGEPELFESFFSDFKKTGDLTVHSSFRSVHGAKTVAYGKTLEMIVSEQALRENTFARP